MPEKKRKKHGLWRLAKGVLITAALLLAISWILRIWLGIDPPEVPESRLQAEEVVTLNDSLWSLAGNRLHLNREGLYEMYLEGAPFDRGVAAGKLASDLLYYQEKVFVDQIRQLIPSDTYLMFLRNLIGFYNRKLPEHIPLEYRQEIYGISLSCTDEYDFIGTPYERQLNYHAAHDLGHAMQDYMLVGCTSFAGWGSATPDSSLLIGRNFDFYVGDDFARNKVVLFYRPEQGYAFASVSWAGMTGVLSGMNSEGLTVTINAARSVMPTSSATPISVLCREILQYASTIAEAYEIAGKHRVFVSESILIGSAKDKRAAIIEKTPEKIGLYLPDGDHLVCANHYQSDSLRCTPENIENIQTSDSPYRQERMEELLERSRPVDPLRAVAILRDHRGLQDKAIGLGNEKAMNQFIGHHSVVFAPEKGLMWVSTSPWQSGEYVAYDLNRIFSGKELTASWAVDSLNIPADLFVETDTFRHFLSYREWSKKIPLLIKEKKVMSEQEIQAFIATNPEYYAVYECLGDYHASRKEAAQAEAYWKQALEKEIPRQSDRERIARKLAD